MINIILNSNVAEQAEIVVYDLCGEKIKSLDIDYDGHSLVTLDVSSFTRGVYFLSVNSKHCFSTKEFTVIR